MTATGRRVLWQGPSQLMKLSEIAFFTRLYPRKEVDQHQVDRYADAMKAGAQFPALKVGLYQDQKILLDGAHRLQACRKNNLEYFEVQLAKFRTEAEFFAEAVRCNADHGKGYTAQELKENIKRLQKYNFDVKDIVAITSVSAASIHREAAAPVTTLTTPCGKKKEIAMPVVSAAQAAALDLVQFRNSLKFVSDFADAGKISQGDGSLLVLVTRCRDALDKWLSKVEMEVPV